MLATVPTTGLGRADDAYSTWEHPHAPTMVTILLPAVPQLHVDGVIVMSSLPSPLQWL